ncbi:HpcH/HpaI aldolase/citrate lyase family protein [Bordetella genomosp. 9]|uniref:CoA ester lyase n=1 Tax=Bordetella genomosp. 9 TaxID=1416803 RepID=A0A1W6Z4K7_9BORD|nr:CoA ester lyase [Bordetella genomosp. 9]ARP88292.1 CoA ester lyase [Bordetella genomosp. 9]ARP92878.1 CoA ester lyase [Bordetella genomosp. 9]
MTVFRSFLFAPANHARRVEKALALDADAVILDLEDACAVSEKAASRAKVVEAMRQPRRCLGYVRVNPLHTVFAYGDLTETIRPGLDGVVLPKVESASDVRTADWLMRQLERERGMPEGGVDLIPIIETAQGVARLPEILTAAPRVRRVAFGAGDFTLDLDLTWTRDETELAPYRAQIVMQSRAAGLEPPLDTVWVDLKDPEGCEASARKARELGFQGKLCIHPDQIAMVNRAFSPSDAQIERARRVLDAFAQAEAQGSSAIQLDGQFIDYPIVYAAQRVVAMAERLSGRAA